MNQFAQCPSCGEVHPHECRDAEGFIECSCGEKLKYVVPIFHPSVGGPAEWGWATTDGRFSWDPL